ncbi:site-specific integrase [Rosenbergiella metrosideri]|uniref:site-specific integrase n=2 Tax=Rosenbergiella TaxID=1356488 RepID=UPI001F4FCA22|nr:site-specific integrase [Rosenbergiella metrosideri]
MAARRRTSKTSDLPPNLYCRDGYYSYRDPRTGKEFGLGRDKRYSVTQAIEANMSMSSHKVVSLVDRINGHEGVLFEDWAQRYLKILERRSISKSSMSEYRSRVKAVSARFDKCDLTEIRTKDVASFLDEYVQDGKDSRAKLIRSTMLDMFREAISEGLLSVNPVESTRNSRITVKRNRLSVQDLKGILLSSYQMQDWVSLSIELAIVTGQRVSDICKMKWSDVKDGKLWIEQKKTGAKLTIPLSIQAPNLEIKLSDVIDRCRESYGKCETLIASRTGQMLTVKSISRSFSQARDKSGCKWEGDPPSFHEIRSLSARLYASDKSNEFAQRLLGHKSAQMSERYIDSRGSEWLDVGL